MFVPSEAFRHRPETSLNQRSSFDGPIRATVWETKPNRSFYGGRLSPAIDGSEVAKTAGHPSRPGMRTRVRPSVRAHPRKNNGVVLMVGALVETRSRHWRGLHLTLEAVGSMVDVGPAGSLVRGGQSRDGSN